MIHTAIDYLKSIGEPQQRAEDQRNLGENLLRKIKAWPPFSPSQFEIWDRTTIEMALIYFTGCCQQLSIVRQVMNTISF